MAQLSSCILLTINFVTLRIYCDVSIQAPQHLLYNAHRLSRIEGLGSSHFARRYFGNHCYFLFVLLLRCFSSQAFLLIDYLIHQWIMKYKLHRVSPFGILGIKGFQRLPRAYRSFTRPSSAVGTKASTVSSLQLYLTYSKVLTITLLIASQLTSLRLTHLITLVIFTLKLQNNIYSIIFTLISNNFLNKFCLKKLSLVFIMQFSMYDFQCLSIQACALKVGYHINIVLQELYSSFVQIIFDNRTLLLSLLHTTSTC